MQKENKPTNVIELKWILGAKAIPTLNNLTKSFRQAAVSQVVNGGAYLPWMDSYEDHRSSALFRPHELRNYLLVDQHILSLLESVFMREGNPLGLILPEENSFRINRDISDSVLESKRYNDGIELFLSAGSYWRDLFSTLCSFIVPIYSTRSSVRRGGVGFSSLRARGAIFLSLPNDEKYSRLNLAINLAHELGHQSLMIYQGADRILDSDLDAPLYSVIRKTQRPAINSFHGVVALAFMAKFIAEVLNAGSLSDEERKSSEQSFLEIRQDLGEAICKCSRLRFTKVGEKLFDECKEILIQVLKVVL